MNPVNFCFIHTIVFIFLKSQYTSLKKEISLLEKHHILGFDENIASCEMNPVNFCFIHTIVFIFLKSQYTSLKKEISLLEKHHILGFDENFSDSVLHWFLLWKDEQGKTGRNETEKADDIRKEEVLEKHHILGFDENFSDSVLHWFLLWKDEQGKTGRNETEKADDIRKEEGVIVWTNENNRLNFGYLVYRNLLTKKSYWLHHY